MKAVYVAMMAAAGIVMAGQAQADEALAKAKNCMSCHAIDKKWLARPTRKLPPSTRAMPRFRHAWPPKSRLAVRAPGVDPDAPNNVTEDEAKKLVAWFWPK